MAVTSKLYGNVFKAAFNKEIDWVDDTIKAQAHTSSYTPDQDAHDYQNDLSAEVAAGSGYSTGGVTLGSKTSTYTGATNKHSLDAADAPWTGAGFTFRTIVVLDTSGAGASSNPLISYHQNDADVSPDGTDLTIQWHADGIASITVS